MHELARWKSKRKLEQQLARRFPQPAGPNRLARLPRRPVAQEANEDGGQGCDGLPQGMKGLSGELFAHRGEVQPVDRPRPAAGSSAKARDAGAEGTFWNSEPLARVEGK